MAADRLALPPVRLLPEEELARLALRAPLLERAVRLAHWAAPQVPVDAMGELMGADRKRAAAELGLDGEPDGRADTSQAWDVAVDTGLVELEIGEAGTGAAGIGAADPEDGDPEDGDPEKDEPAGKAVPGEALAKLTAAAPNDILQVWLAAAESALAEAAATPDPGETDWDPEEQAGFLDSALANLYAFGAMDETSNEAVPLPVLAASLVVPDDMGEPTDAVLEEVTEVMMRLDDHFRLLVPTGLVDYRPVDEALIQGEEEQDEGDAPGEGAPEELDPEEVSRYGLVRLTPVGLFGVRARLLESGVHAPALGDLADRPAAVLLGALTGYPDGAARDEVDLWLSTRKPGDAARELLAAARGDDRGAPGRRLMCQQALSLVGAEAEPAVREVLDDRQLGGLARVWLAERGVVDVPAPDERMVFWLTVDTLAAQLDAGDNPELLGELVRDLVARHDGFFDAVWRIDHPATSEVLEAMGRLHPDKKVAKDARKAAFKSRSRA